MAIYPLIVMSCEQRRDLTQSLCPGWPVAWWNAFAGVAGFQGCPFTRLQWQRKIRQEKGTTSIGALQYCFEHKKRHQYGQIGEYMPTLIRVVRVFVERNSKPGEWWREIQKEVKRMPQKCRYI